MVLGPDGPTGPTEGNGAESLRSSGIGRQPRWGSPPAGAGVQSGRPGSPPFSETTPARTLPPVPYHRRVGDWKREERPENSSETPPTMVTPGNPVLGRRLVQDGPRAAGSTRRLDGQDPAVPRSDTDVSEEGDTVFMVQGHRCTLSTVGSPRSGVYLP